MVSFFSFGKPLRGPFLQADFGRWGRVGVEFVIFILIFSLRLACYFWGRIIFINHIHFASLRSCD